MEGATREIAGLPVVQFLTHSKIDQSQVELLVDEGVAGLEVLVHIALLVDILQGDDDLCNYDFDKFWWYLFIKLKNLSQVDTFGQLE